MHDFAARGAYDVADEQDLQRRCILEASVSIASAQPSGKSMPTNRALHSDCSLSVTMLVGS
jgi:hypothetical protein